MARKDNRRISRPADALPSEIGWAWQEWFPNVSPRSDGGGFISAGAAVLGQGGTRFWGMRPWQHDCQAWQTGTAFWGVRTSGDGDGRLAPGPRNNRQYETTAKTLSNQGDSAW